MPNYFNQVATSGRGETWLGTTGGGRASTGSRPWGSPPTGRGGYPPHSGQPRWQQKRDPVPRTPSPPLGPVLATIRVKDLDTAADLNEHSAKITDCKYVASYNWMNMGEPVIMVPGEPPVWTPLQTPEKLKADSGKYFHDPNAARYPKHPTEPAVRAIFTEQADFLASSIDIFACGSTVGNLLRFVRKIDNPFRFLIEVVGDTVFFIRRENSPTELIPDVRGYGHTFPETYTTWDTGVKGSESHQRIIQYTFAGLRFLVRFEGDGFHRDLVPNEPQQSHTSGKSAKNHQDTDLGLSDALALSSLGQQASPATPNKDLTIKSGGQRIPQSAIFELKTRSIKKIDQNVLSDELPRLWIAQIPNFILAYHTSGVFTEIRTQNVCKEIKAWETENEDILRQFAALLRKIIEFAKSRSDRKLEVRRTGTGTLELREQVGEGSSVLPPEIEILWLGKPNGEKEDEKAAEDRYFSPFDDGDDYFYQSDESIKDFTACSADGCEYCGHCTY